ncbi:MAG: hypothetical protein FWC00_00130 [Firmicutes bacterium]|nr:hypothetical protein [Bacillota bacterium]
MVLTKEYLHKVHNVFSDVKTICRELPCHADGTKRDIPYPKTTPFSLFGSVNRDTSSVGFEIGDIHTRLDVWKYTLPAEQEYPHIWLRKTDTNEKIDDYEKLCFLIDFSSKGIQTYASNYGLLEPLSESKKQRLVEILDEDCKHLLHQTDAENIGGILANGLHLNGETGEYSHFADKNSRLYYTTYPLEKEEASDPLRLTHSIYGNQYNPRMVLLGLPNQLGDVENEKFRERIAVMSPYAKRHIIPPEFVRGVVDFRGNFESNPNWILSRGNADELLNKHRERMHITT